MSLDDLRNTLLFQLPAQDRQQISDGAQSGTLLETCWRSLAQAQVGYTGALWAAESFLNDLDRKTRRVSGLEKEILRLKSEAESLTKEKAEIADARNSLVEALHASDDKKVELQRQLEKKSAELLESQEGYLKLKKAYDQLSSVDAAKQTRIDRMSEAEGRAIAKISGLESKVASLEKQISKAAEVSQKAEEEHKAALKKLEDAHEAKSKETESSYASQIDALTREWSTRLAAEGERAAKAESALESERVRLQAAKEEAEAYRLKVSEHERVASKLRKKVDLARSRARVAGEKAVAKFQGTQSFKHLVSSLSVRHFHQGVYYGIGLAERQHGVKTDYESDAIPLRELGDIVVPAYQIEPPPGSEEEPMNYDTHASSDEEDPDHADKAGRPRPVLEAEVTEGESSRATLGEEGQKPEVAPGESVSVPEAAATKEAAEVPQVAGDPSGPPTSPTTEGPSVVQEKLDAPSVE